MALSYATFDPSESKADSVEPLERKSMYRCCAALVLARFGLILTSCTATTHRAGSPMTGRRRSHVERLVDDGWWNGRSLLA